MRHRDFIFFLMISPFCCMAQYAPAAGQVGTTAIHKDSSIIVAWASGITVTRGYVNISDTTETHEGSNFASFGVPENALGAANGISENVVSLGDGGNAILTFLRPIKNGLGPDFCIFENGINDNFLELAHVEVSSDGLHYVRFPSSSLTQTGTQIGTFGTIDPTKISNLAGKYRQGFGTPFDLQDLSDSSGIDLNHITHVRIIDVVGSIDPIFGSADSQGNMINDLFPTPFFSCGFDLDAVGVIHQGELNLDKLSYSEVFVFPNPNSGVFSLQTNGFDIEEIRLIDSLGKEMDIRISQQGNTFDLNNYVNPGFYTIKIRTRGGFLYLPLQVF